MKRFITNILILIFCFQFYTCSWQEEFVIINSSEQALLITITTSNANGGFEIFDKVPTVFAVDKEGEIKRDKSLQFQFDEVEDRSIQFNLPPKTCAIIGNLSNDKYEKYNQEFINGRKFNLVSIQIKTAHKTISIYPSNFDNHFKKSNGKIEYRIQ